jgi:hypothetical protein
MYSYAFLKSMAMRDMAFNTLYIFGNIQHAKWEKPLETR